MSTEYHPRAAAPPPARRLIGIGVGPGDPELLTLRAVRELREADAVLVPGGSVSPTVRREVHKRN